MSTASTYMHGAKRYTVVATVCVVRTGGAQLYLQKGAPVPADVAQRMLDHLLSAGLIAEVEATK